MKNALKYHLIADWPVLLFTFLLIYDHMAGRWFALAMVIYAFTYRPMIDRERLIALGLYQGESFRKMFWVLRFRHYSEMMFANPGDDHSTSDSRKY